MYFADPILFMLLLALPGLLLLYAWSSARRRREEASFMNAAALGKLAPGRRPGRRLLSLLLCMAAIVMIVLAMTGPLIGARMQEVKQRGIDVIFALDVSDSMRAEDIKPGRFQAARRITEFLAEKLRVNQVGLVSFAGQSFLECPLTLDQGAFRMLLSASGPGVIPAGGSDISSAIGEAMRNFTQSDARGKMIIIISDGENLQGDYKASSSEAASAGAVIHTISVGYPEGAPIPFRDERGNVMGYKKDKNGKMVLTRMDPGVLRTIASEAGGRYFEGAAIYSEWAAIAKQIEQMKKGDLAARKADRYENRFAYALFIGFLLLFCDTILPEGTRRNPTGEEK
jgi:Ca-activated chloride channel family protein